MAITKQSYESDKQGTISKLVGELGNKDMKPAELTPLIFAELKKAKIEFSESTVKQYISTARDEKGWVEKRTGRTSSKGEVSLEDAIAFVEDMDRSVGEIRELIGKFLKVGDLKELDAQLANIEKIQKLKK
jgi:hypothetical protein